MPYSLLSNVLPEIAEKETRTVIVPPGLNTPLPPDTYAFCEMFCDEPGCDCRRVFFFVASEKQNSLLAVIAYGWESPDFYAKWLKMDDPEAIAELMGPMLNKMSPQSQLAPQLLNLFNTVLLPDAAYIDRVKRHYQMFRREIDKNQKEAVKHERQTNIEFAPSLTARNALCPCGSGKKFKRCCAR